MSDNMPDFDNMSQEEIMAWMETLAKRQGATEGMTTSADVDIPEIDPSTVVIDEPGYVPYGQEKTQPMAAQPPAPKAPEKPASSPASAAPPRAQTPTAPPAAPPVSQPQRPPVTPPAPPARTPTPPAASSQERIAPARPQQTPPAPAQPPRPTSIPPAPAQPPRPTSIPPAPPASQPPRTPPPTPAQSVRPPAQTPPAPQQPQRTQTPPPPPAPPARTPSAPPPSMSQERTPPTKIPTPPPSMPASQPPRSPVPPPAPPPAPPADDNSLDWLESLAAGQGDDLFNLDLSDIPSATHAPTDAPEAPSNPMTWLEDLARSQVAEPSLEHLGSVDADEEESEKLDPFAENVNPMEWLETLARRQGAKDEELTTGASLNIPQAHAAEVEQQGYQPFSFDTPPTRRSPEPAAPTDPADFLNSLAGEQGYSESGVLATQPDEILPDNLSMTAIEDALSSGTVTREQMQKFLDQTTNQMAETPEELEEVDLGLDEPLAPAEIPDWLSDLMPSAPPPAAPTPTKPIDALFEAPASVDMPDWLRQDVLGDASASDIDSIFEESEPLTPIDVAPMVQEQPREPIEVDTSDPWVAAFDEEYEQGGAADVNAVPEWYEQNVHDPERIAAVEGQTPYEESIELEDAPLPAENGLTAGQVQGIPEWVTGFEQRAEAEEATPTNVFDDMPDWLKEVESSVTPQDVPDWLVETISTQDEVIEPEYEEPVAEVYAPPPAPVIQAPTRPTPTPAPTPKPVQPPPQPRVAAPTGPVAEVIERARDREQSGDLEGALAEYESMIRTNSGLDAVVEELGLLVKSYKTTPAVYRVLGDGLMRQGKLQQALNTYREALNQI